MPASTRSTSLNQALKIVLTAGSLSLDADGNIAGVDEPAVTRFVDHAIATAGTSPES
ncbi:hypothetical protein BMS3Bbin02_02122 [bacterium BMS3Bbin02]|nr:hypothetical protein BMS3Bbin02_02122 [bacterium BMS3Bbin02]